MHKGKKGKKDLRPAMLLPEKPFCLEYTMLRITESLNRYFIAKWLNYLIANC